MENLRIVDAEGQSTTLRHGDRITMNLVGVPGNMLAVLQLSRGEGAPLHWVSKDGKEQKLLTRAIASEEQFGVLAALMGACSGLHIGTSVSHSGQNLFEHRFESRNAS